MENNDWFSKPEKTIEDMQAIHKAEMYGFLQRNTRKY